MTDIQPPLIEIAVEPKTKGDQEKMGQALARLATEDPSFRVVFDHESGQTIIEGMSEPHFEIILDRLKREFKVEANIGAPQVAYRETISRKIAVDYTHKKLPGAPRPSTPTNVVLISSGASFTFENELVASGASQYARVVMTMEPLPPGSGFTFANEVADGVVPEEYVPAVEKGVKTSLDNGVLAGFPVIDLKVTLTDGAYHEVDFERARLRDRGTCGDEGRSGQGRAEAA